MAGLEVALAASQVFHFVVHIIDVALPLVRRVMGGPEYRKCIRRGLVENTRVSHECERIIKKMNYSPYR